MHDFPLYFKFSNFSTVEFCCYFLARGGETVPVEWEIVFQCMSYIHISLGFSTLSVCLSVLAERRFGGSRSINQIDQRKRVGGLEREGWERV